MDKKGIIGGKGSKEFYKLIKAGKIKECKAIIVVDGKRYKVGLMGADSEINLYLVEFDQVAVRPEWILEGKTWYIEK